MFCKKILLAAYLFLGISSLCAMGDDPVAGDSESESCSSEYLSCADTMSWSSDSDGSDVDLVDCCADFVSSEFENARKTLTSKINNIFMQGLLSKRLLEQFVGREIDLNTFLQRDFDALNRELDSLDYSTFFTYAERLFYQNAFFGDRASLDALGVFFRREMQA